MQRVETMTHMRVGRTPASGSHGAVQSKPSTPSTPPPNDPFALSGSWTSSQPTRSSAGDGPATSGQSDPFAAAASSQPVRGSSTAGASGQSNTWMGLSSVAAPHQSQPALVSMHLPLLRGCCSYSLSKMIAVLGR